MAPRNDVLVGVDGSEASTAAVIWAAHEARSRGCALGIVHAADPSYYRSSTWLLEDELRESCRSITETAHAKARDVEPQLPTRTAVLIGSPTRTLLALSRTVNLLVVGRSGHRALPRVLLGSVPQRLMANAACPLVIVGGRPHGPTEPLACVVAAVEDVDRQTETLDFALATARRRGVAVHVLHAIAPHTRPQAGQETRRRIDQALSPWRARYPDVAMHLEAHTGSLRKVIAANCTPRELLVLGHHPHTRFAPHTPGARTKAALAAAPCPVVVVRELLGGAETVATPAPANSQLERSNA